jgi:hypothetical protein
MCPMCLCVEKKMYRLNVLPYLFAYVLKKCRRYYYLIIDELRQN